MNYKRNMSLSSVSAVKKLSIDLKLDHKFDQQFQELLLLLRPYFIPHLRIYTLDVGTPLVEYNGQFSPNVSYHTPTDFHRNFLLQKQWPRVQNQAMI